MDPKNFKDYLAQARVDYGKDGLNENDLLSTPFLQFEKWFLEAVNGNVFEPYAMTLSTVSDNNRPSSRIVLLRGYDQNGFIFYTNYLSKKGTHLSKNNFACLNFFWPQLERQIRIEGTVTKVSETQSEEYFATRPRESRIGAWVSNQSEKIPNRDFLNEKIPLFEEKFKGIEVDKPVNWGGYILKPDYFEFWQGRPSRLHDRIAFELVGDNWKIDRLSP